MGEQQIGPTGKFPDGKIGPGDDGELALRVSSGQGIVALEFGKQVSWLGLQPHQAKELAKILLKHANAAGPFVVEVRRSEAGDNTEERL